MLEHKVACHFGESRNEHTLISFTKIKGGNIFVRCYYGFKKEGDSIGVDRSGRGSNGSSGVYDRARFIENYATSIPSAVVDRALDLEEGVTLYLNERNE